MVRGGQRARPRGSPPPLGGPRPPAGSYGPQAGLRPGPQAALPARHPPEGPAAPPYQAPQAGQSWTPGLTPPPGQERGLSGSGRPQAVTRTWPARGPPLRGAKTRTNRARPASRPPAQPGACARRARPPSAAGQGPGIPLLKKRGLWPPSECLRAGHRRPAKALAAVRQGVGVADGFALVWRPAPVERHFRAAPGSRRGAVGAAEAPGLRRRAAPRRRTALMNSRRDLGRRPDFVSLLIT